MIIIDDHCWQRQIPEHHKRNIKKQELRIVEYFVGWDGELETCRLWELLVRICPFLNLTAEWRTALCTARQSRAERQCGESWHTVTVTLSQMRQQKLPRTWGPRTQGPPKNTHCWQQTIGLSWKLIGRVICWQKSCVLFFSLQLFLNRANVWVVNPNGHLTCWTGGHFSNL